MATALHNSNSAHFPVEFIDPLRVAVVTTEWNYQITDRLLDGVLKYFKENGITFDVILDEGGAIIEPPLGGMKCDKCAMIAVHEKGRYYLDLKAEAANAHASLTSASSNTPVERMSMFISVKTIFRDMFHL